MKKVILIVVLVCVSIVLKAQTYYNGHEYVDMGLSVKWATCNVGADSFKGNGDYFAWGEISPKNNFSEDNYRYHSNPSTLPPYADAASVNWGGSWRMPTLEELQELMDNCTYDAGSYGEVSGYRFVSKINGNSIFFPDTGSCDENGFAKVGVLGTYWLSSLNTENSQYAYFFVCDEGMIATILLWQNSEVYTNSYSRYIGRTIRPVF